MNAIKQRNKEKLSAFAVDILVNYIFKVSTVESVTFDVLLGYLKKFINDDRSEVGQMVTLLLHYGADGSNDNTSLQLENSLKKILAKLVMNKIIEIDSVTVRGHETVAYKLPKDDYDTLVKKLKNSKQL